VGKEIFASKYGKLTLLGEIRNLFDRRHEHVLRYPMPGRTLLIGMRYEF